MLKISDLIRSNAIAGTLVASMLVGSIAWAHCDQMDGPVVIDAQAALEQADVTRVLKWIPAGDEQEIRDAFERTLVVRGQSPEARELADRFYFETLIRVHRASEGVAFTGLNHAGTPISPGIALADQALETGSVDALAAQIGQAVEQSIREQFEQTMRTRAQKDQSVEAGRAYVAEYVPFVHYVKNLHELLEAGPRAHQHAGVGLGHAAAKIDARRQTRNSDE